MLAYGLATVCRKAQPVRLRYRAVSPTHQVHILSLGDLARRRVTSVAGGSVADRVEVDTGKRCTVDVTFVAVPR